MLIQLLSLLLLLCLTQPSQAETFSRLLYTEDFWSCVDPALYTPRVGGPSASTATTLGGRCHAADPAEVVTPGVDFGSQWPAGTISFFSCFADVNDATCQITCDLQADTVSLLSCTISNAASFQLCSASGSATITAGQSVRVIYSSNASCSSAAGLRPSSLALFK